MKHKAYMNYSKISGILDKAASIAKPVEQVSSYRNINLEEAYGIQCLSIGRRYKRAERFVGIKLGFTSKAKMEQMGVHDLIWGRLTDRMQYLANEKMDRSQFIHPRAEPEVAFLLKKPIDKVLDRESAKEYIESVCIAIEVIDSRYKNFKFSLEDVVADNCSSAGFILGEWLSPDVDYHNSEIELWVNDELKQKGNTSAILGDPLESFLEASRMIMESDEDIDAGDIVLAGAATAAEYIDSGMKVEAKSPQLGSVILDID